MSDEEKAHAVIVLLGKDKEGSDKNAKLPNTNSTSSTYKGPFSSSILNALVLLSASLIVTMVLYHRAHDTNWADQQHEGWLSSQPGGASLYYTYNKTAIDSRIATFKQNIAQKTSDIFLTLNDKLAPYTPPAEENAVNSFFSPLHESHIQPSHSSLPSHVMASSSSSSSSSSGTFPSHSSSNENTHHTKDEPIELPPTTDPQLIQARHFFHSVKILRTKVDKTLRWIVKFGNDKTNVRWDRISNGEVHILYKLHSYLDIIISQIESEQGNKLEDAIKMLFNLAESGYTCEGNDRKEQYIISKEISMDICSEIEWYKLAQLAAPDLTTFVDVGANKGYLGSLFVSLWAGGKYNMYPQKLFDLSNKKSLYVGSKNPAGYCRDGYNYGVPLFCPALPENPSVNQHHITSLGERDFETGICKSQDNLDFRLNSFDGSSYLKDSVSSMIVDISKEKPLSKDKRTIDSESTILSVKDMWTYNHMAVSSEVGTARFTKQSANKNPGFEGGRIRGTNPNLDGTEEVEVVTVDSFVKKQKIMNPNFILDVLKIDSEGNDNKVIDGAMETIKTSVKLLTFEGGGGVTFSYELSEQLNSIGFSCFSTSRAGLFKWNSDCMVREYFGGLRQKDKGNIFCVNRKRAPLMGLAYDALSFALMGQLTSNATVRDKVELTKLYINIKPFCTPWPACVGGLMKK